MSGASPARSLEVAAACPPLGRQQGRSSAPPARGALGLALVLAVACAPSVVADADALPLIQARGGKLVDALGRERVLRGVNARVAGVFDVTFDDGRTALEDIPAYTDADAARIRALGFSFLRLPISWSGLEPVEGDIDADYLARVADVVALNRAHGLYTLVDFHQDAYSKEIGEDGAPAWAILPAPTAVLGGPMSSGDLSNRRRSQQVLDAFASFFRNDADLQARFEPALAAVVDRFADDDSVVGFEIMNEPVAFLVDNGAALLDAFSIRMAAVVRAHDARHAVWIEPDALRNGILEAPVRDAPFPDDNVVYAPHLYPGILGAHDTRADWTSALSDTFGSLRAETASWGAPVALGEWGTYPDDATAPAYAAAIHALVDELNGSDAVWLWKETSQDHWGFFAEDGSERPSAQIFVHPYALAVPGTLTKQLWDEDARTLTIDFDADPAASGAVLDVPASTYPGGFTLTLDGAVVADASAGRIAVPWNPTAGAHLIVVRPRAH